MGLINLLMMCWKNENSELNHWLVLWNHYYYGEFNHWFSETNFAVMAERWKGFAAEEFETKMEEFETDGFATKLQWYLKQLQRYLKWYYFQWVSFLLFLRVEILFIYIILTFKKLFFLQRSSWFTFSSYDCVGRHIGKIYWSSIIFWFNMYFVQKMTTKNEKVTFCRPPPTPTRRPPVLSNSI